MYWYFCQHWSPAAINAAVGCPVSWKLIHAFVVFENMHGLFTLMSILKDNSRCNLNSSSCQIALLEVFRYPMVRAVVRILWTPNRYEILMKYSPIILFQAQYIASTLVAGVLVMWQWTWVELSLWFGKINTRTQKNAFDHEFLQKYAFSHPRKKLGYTRTPVPTSCNCFDPVCH